MNRHLPIFLFVILFVACSRENDRIFPFGWERVNPASDSLIECLEHKFFEGADSAAICTDVAALYDVARQNPQLPVLVTRATYWDARARLRFDNPDSAGILFHRAESIAQADSARFPYDLARIRWNIEPDYIPLTADYYQTLVADEAFFEQQQDYPLAAAKSMDIAMLFTDLGAVDRSWPWLDRADSLFAIAGLDANIMKNKINRAKNYEILCRLDSLNILLDAVISDPRIDLDPIARDIALSNRYTLLGDTAALHRAYSWVADRASLPDLQGLYESYLAREFAREGRIDSALIYITRAGAKYEYMEDPTFLRDYYASRTEVMDSLGFIDSAFAALSVYAQICDTIAAERASVQVLRAAVMGEIDAIRAADEARHKRSVILLISLIFCILVAGLIVTLFVYRRIQLQRIARMNDALTFEQAQRRVLALQLAMDEADLTVNAISEEIDGLAAEGSIDPPTSLRLQSIVKSHAATKREQEAFLATFAEIRPDFIPNLRAAHPNLSEADVRLAAFIVLGLDNKHIARLISVRPDSVKQARWRLRSKLALSSGDSLLDTLSRF